MLQVGKSYGSDGRLDRLIDSLRRTLGSKEIRDPDIAQAQARHLVDRMALALQGSLMLECGSADAAEVFCASRLGREGTWNYGSLAPSDDPKGDVARSAALVERFLQSNP